MRLGDGTDLLGVNDPRSASIGIIRVDPTDVRQDVLTAILAQNELNRKQIVIVLHEQNKAFQRPVDFDGLKDMRRTLKADMVIVARAGSSSAEFARQRRFPVYSSLESFASSMQDEEPVQDNRKGWFGRRQKAGAPAGAVEQMQPLPVILPDPEPGNIAPPGVPAPAQAGAQFRDDEEEMPTLTFPTAGAAAVGAAGIAAVGATYLDHNDEDELAPLPMKPTTNGMSRKPGGIENPPGVNPPPSARSGNSDIIKFGKNTKELQALVPPVAAADAADGVAAASAAAPKPKPVNRGNGQKRRVAPLGAVAAGGLGAAAFAANVTQTGGAPPGGGTIGGQGSGGGGGRPRRRSRRLLALLLVLLTVLLLAGIAFASQPGQQVLKNILPGTTTTATVTITPVSQDVKNTYVITAVTGTPDTAKRQVQARIVSVTSPSQSASAHATGSIPGKQATGTLTFVNTGNLVTIPGGRLTSKSGAVIAFNGITVPFGSVSEAGIAVSAGVNGNIPVNNISFTFSNGVVVRNTTAFSGGIDPVPNAVITPTDIKTASNNLIKAIKPQAQSQLAGLVKSSEDVVPNSLSCKTSVSANHNAGDVAPTVTVMGTATCSEEVYDKAGALKLASDLLTAQAAQNPGANYLPAQNKIVTGVTGVTVIDTNQTISLLVSADGIWVYQFTTQIKQQLANAIANKSKADALTYLKAQPGVKDVSLTISNGGGTLPGASDITFNILGVNGPTSTPTLSVGSPTVTTAPGSTPTPSPTPQNGQGGS